ncbi:MAG: hypothetical protein EBX23_06570 [Proteobacteria bacterium]|nr:hypothetical protein [Pseudomonadota bacterium]
MRIAKYPFAVLSAALFTVLLVTPISSISNIIWLSSVDMPISLLSALEVLLFDFQRLGIALFAVFTIAFSIAFTVAGLVSKFTNFGDRNLYAMAGAVAIGVVLILMVELLFQTQLLGGNRSFIGKILHWVAGFFGGYFFYNLISSDRSYTFVIRFFGVFYAYFLLGLVLNWIFTPASAAADFGFVLNELSDSAQNALLRDFTSFFVATFVFSIFGAITLNPVWFFSAGIVYYGAALFNLMAVYVHGTAYNQIYIGEIVLGTWPTLLALTVIYKNKSSN